MKVITKSPDETISLGRELGNRLSAGDVIALTGELGTGKTTFTKGIAVGMGVKKIKVRSPSFILINQILGGRLPLYHFDLYRLNTLREIQGLGYEEYFYGVGVSVIEWAEKIKGILPELLASVHVFAG